MTCSFVVSLNRICVHRNSNLGIGLRFDSLFPEYPYLVKFRWLRKTVFYISYAYPNEVKTEPQALLSPY